MRYPCLLLLVLFAADSGFADEVYRWRDGDGQVVYSDTTPPPDARDAERKRLGDRAPEPVLPYALQQARRDFPVTLFIAEGCGSPCSQAAAYLAARGVPYIERNAGDDDTRNVLSAIAAGGAQVPLLLVGRTALRGFQESAWARALDAASYPKTSLLPSGADPRQPAMARKETAKAAATDDAAPAAAPVEGD